MGQSVSHNEESINDMYKKYQNIDLKEIFYTTIMMIKQNYLKQMNQE